MAGKWLVIYTKDLGTLVYNLDEITEIGIGGATLTIQENKRVITILYNNIEKVDIVNNDELLKIIRAEVKKYERKTKL